MTLPSPPWVPIDLVYWLVGSYLAGVGTVTVLAGLFWWATREKP